jgi:RNA polymerase sigma factor (TIGR02999 family)
MSQPKANATLTALIAAWNHGDREALGAIVELAYPELHAIADGYFRRERPGHTLQCTALINEAYLRMVDAPVREWKNRAHFFGFAAHLMRGILVDHARARRAAKRGGGALTITVSERHAATDPPEVDVIDLHDALEALEKLDPQQSRVLELRYFGGLTIEETAEVMGTSASTVKRDWILAKTWIRRRLLRSKAPA